MTTIRLIRFIGFNIYAGIVGAVCIIFSFLKQESTWFEIKSWLKNIPHNIGYVCRLVVTDPRQFALLFLENVIVAPFAIAFALFVIGRIEYDRMQEEKIRKSH